MIEIMVVVVLVGFMATMILPRMFRRPSAAEWPSLLDEVNNLVLFARQEAIANQQTHRIKFKRGKAGENMMVVEVEKDNPDKPDQKIYEKAYSHYFNTEYNFSEYIVIKGLYKGKKETMAENKNEGYCYVIPDGLVEDVILQLTRTYDKKISKASFKMRPFLGKFEFHEGYVKSE